MVEDRVPAFVTRTGRVGSPWTSAFSTFKGMAKPIDMTVRSEFGAVGDQGDPAAFGAGTWNS